MDFSEIYKHVKPIKKQDIFFRLYYTKKSIEYSMEEKDGDYITITAEQFAIANPLVTVKDGKIHKNTQLNIGKLVLHNKGQGTAKDDITIIKHNSDTKWEFKTYED